MSGKKEVSFPVEKTDVGVIEDWLKELGLIDSSDEVKYECLSAWIIWKFLINLLNSVEIFIKLQTCFLLNSQIHTKQSTKKHWICEEPKTKLYKNASSTLNFSLIFCERANYTRFSRFSSPFIDNRLENILIKIKLKLIIHKK